MKMNATLRCVVWEKSINVVVERRGGFDSFGCEINSTEKEIAEEYTRWLWNETFGTHGLKREAAYVASTWSPKKRIWKPLFSKFPIQLFVNKLWLNYNAILIHHFINHAFECNMLTFLAILLAASSCLGGELGSKIAQQMSMLISKSSQVDFSADLSASSHTRRRVHRPTSA